MTVRNELPLLAVTRVHVPRAATSSPRWSPASSSAVGRRQSRLEPWPRRAWDAQQPRVRRPGVRAARSAPRSPSGRRGRRRAAAAARPAPAALLGSARRPVGHLARRHRGPPRHRPAVLPAPRRRHGRRATPARPRDARRRGPGHRLARLPRRRPRRRARRPRRRPSRCSGCATGSRPSSAEVRLSVQTLRTDVRGQREPRAPPISGLARHLSESSGIPIRVTVNERTTRLRPEIESELLRIAQEAMTNAVRHSGADRDRRRLPGGRPHGRDHGPRRRRAGSGRARPDSFGLDIMRERAAPDRRGPRGRRRRAPAAPSSGARSVQTRAALSRSATSPVTRCPCDHCDDRAPGRRPRPDPRRPHRHLLRAARHGGARRRGHASPRRSRCYEEHKPDVVVTDLQLQDGTGLDVVRRVRREDDPGRPRGAHHARRRRPDLRGHGGRGLGLRRQGRPLDRGRQGGPPRRRLPPLLPLRRPRPGDDAARQRASRPGSPTASTTSCCCSPTASAPPRSPPGSTCRSRR